mgnify:FL=1
MNLQAYEREHIERLRPLLSECTLFLKRNEDFPLAAPGKIALYGSGVRNTIRGGTGSGEVNSRYYDTVEVGFQKAGFTVTSKGWIDGYDKVVSDAMEQFRKNLQAQAKAQHTNIMLLALGAAMPEPEYELPLDAEGDTAIYVLSRISGEGTDRKPEGGSILLSDTEIRDILACKRKYPKFILVLNVGGVVDLSPVLEVENILILSQLGVETGSALARIVLGQQFPSGKLTTTWAAWEQYPPELDYGGYDDTRYREGIYVGYRYFDTVGKKPLFPFGYGMGYTSFAISEERVDLAETKVTVEAKVENTGSFPGKEVVQVYVSVPSGKLDQPAKMLAGWVKTDLMQPGEMRTYAVSFDMREMASFDEETATYLLESGDYIVLVGNSSASTTPVAALCLEQTVTVRRVRNALGKPDFEDLVIEHVRPECRIPVIKVDNSAFVTETVQYDVEYPIDPAVETLSDEQLFLLSNGCFAGKEGLAFLVGNASQSVCGAAGETAHVDGFPVLIMADGPAGIRINQRYFISKKGKKVSMEAPFPQSMVPFMPKALKFMMDRFVIKKPGKHDEVKYQYCTALPIGTAIAQSWNLSLAEACGDIVGREMETFGIDLWLAPALNIHRSIQCGRNFEYYSEDPLIAGRMAAGITKGVQQHPGRAVTIKHYAANNQEFNRSCSNSIVSERAMREIYLKGFELCIREAAPKALMTSYNLINGQHTSTRRDLVEDILRQEFGFSGLVMTDWLIQGGMVPKNAKYAAPDPGAVAAAGGDLYMPGSKADMEKIRVALKEGRLTEKQLRQNATRLLRFWNK